METDGFRLSIHSETFSTFVANAMIIGKKAIRRIYQNKDSSEKSGIFASHLKVGDVCNIPYLKWKLKNIASNTTVINQISSPLQ